MKGKEIKDKKRLQKVLTSSFYFFKLESLQI